MPLPDAVVEQVRQASDLVDVVAERVRLKKQGRRFLGLCPFHNEKTPSFNVVPDEGFYHCFGCKASGDVFRFVQETEGVGFLDAVRLLAERAGIEIAESAPSEAASRAEAMHAALRFAAVFYVEQLETPAGERARAYLEARGFAREAVRAFGIGAAPDGWDALARAAGEAGYDLDTLEAVGLVKRRDGENRGGEPRREGEPGGYDLFRDRLMFPILSPIGKVLGFGGRALPDSRQASADFTPAKYINTPETDVYRKAEVLFGMKQAKRDIRAAEEAIVVEGYADVVSLWQAGVRNVVAASGTALTAAQVDGLRRMAVRRLVLLFDADGAGQAAARKGIDVALDAGLAPYAVSLPDGADPDSFVRQFGAEAFRRRLADARQDFVSFLADRARRAGLLETPEGKREATDDLVAALARLRDPILAEEYVRRAARAIDVAEVDLRREVDRAGRRDAPPPVLRAVPAGPASHPKNAAEADTPGREVVVVVLRAEEEKLLLLMLRSGTPMVEHVLSRMALDEFSDGPAREIAAALVAQYEATGTIDKQPFLRGDHGDAVGALASRVLAPEYDLSERWHSKVGVTRPELDAEPFAVATDAMLGLKAARLSEAVEAAAVRLRAAEGRGEDVTPILGQIQALQRLRMQVDRGEFPDD